MFFSPSKLGALILMCLPFFSFTDPPKKQTLVAFPGAEGFGQYAKGGRSGKVVEVTNTNDDGQGSFRQALLEFPQDPITIVFKVSGLIDLKTDVRINRSDVTIAGQTAPGDGICFKGHSLIINGANTHGNTGNFGNIIIRYIRSRPGGTLSTGLYGIDLENCHDVIIDHCSFSWANEECAALYDTKNTTVQWCIISEGLYHAGHAKGNRSYCGVWGGQNASYYHNVIANQNSRTVRFDGSRAHDTIAIIDYRNNVIYNWGSENACYGGEVEIKGGRSSVNMINNYYLPGPATSKKLKFIKADYDPKKVFGIGQWYMNGNIMRGDDSLNANNFKGLDLKALPSDKREQAIVSQPFDTPSQFKTSTAQVAYEMALLNAGANYPTRDAVDKRIIEEIKTSKHIGMGIYGKPGIIDSPQAVGGWPVYQTLNAPIDSDHDGIPDAWEEKNRLNPQDPKDASMPTKSGYTMLETYLNSLVKSN